MTLGRLMVQGEDWAIESMNEIVSMVAALSLTRLPVTDESTWPDESILRPIMLGPAVLGPIDWMLSPIMQLIGFSRTPPLVRAALATVVGRLLRTTLAETVCDGLRAQPRTQLDEAVRAAWRSIAASLDVTVPIGALACWSTTCDAPNGRLSRCANCQHAICASHRASTASEPSQTAVPRASAQTGRRTVRTAASSRPTISSEVSSVSRELPVVRPSAAPRSLRACSS